MMYVKYQEKKFMKHKLEYIWLDGGEPTPQLRSKTKIVDGEGIEDGDAPIWVLMVHLLIKQKDIVLTVF